MLSSLADKIDCELCRKSFACRHDLLRHQHTIHGEKTLECHLCPYKTTRKDKLVSHFDVHTGSSSDQPLNRKHKNENKTQLSPKKINLPKETQQLSVLKHNISHQDPVTPSKHSRLENLIDPDHNDQFLNDIQKHKIKNTH